MELKSVYESVLFAEKEARLEEAFALIRAIRNRQLTYLKEISKLEKQIKKLQDRHNKGEQKLNHILENNDIAALFAESKEGESE